MEKNIDKTINNNVKKRTAKNNTTKNNIEVEKLKTELNNKDNIIKSLGDRLAKIEEMMMNKKVNEEKVIVKNVEEEDIDKPLATNELINVVSLVNNILILSTEKKGQGTSYIFHEFGETQPIIYGDLLKIIHVQRGFTIDGHFYIANKRFVRTNGLERFYKNIMSPEKLKNIFNLSYNEVVNIFKNSTKTIQDSIVSILIDKMVNDEKIDGNVLYGIQQNYSKNITKAVEDRKELLKARIAMVQ
jgi:hypothetical protein